jgi:hypothetical protein
MISICSWYYGGLRFKTGLFLLRYFVVFLRPSFHLNHIIWAIESTVKWTNNKEVLHMNLDGVWKLLPGIQKAIRFLKLAGWHQWLSDCCIWLPNSPAQFKLIHLFAPVLLLITVLIYDCLPLIKDVSETSGRVGSSAVSGRTKWICILKFAMLSVWPLSQMTILFPNACTCRMLPQCRRPSPYAVTCVLMSALSMRLLQIKCNK